MRPLNGASAELMGRVSRQRRGVMATGLTQSGGRWAVLLRHPGEDPGDRPGSLEKDPKKTSRVAARDVDATTPAVRSRKRESGLTQHKADLEMGSVLKAALCPRCNGVLLPMVQHQGVPQQLS
ncbi:hypothetical protein TREES_T100014892 [Tupaia chinensis]|uniref:Uncharacterized protein n=1 Tax=Tupaia chinensis TaxID=246437 RepID=L9KTP9_TUPCH|nr:hypothetical protein TREES_T100014892 [Tupaia chinensis]